MPFRVFAAGEVLTAANVNDYLAEQAIATFAGTAARASAITAPTEGQFAYLSDSDSLTFYNGSAWVNAGSAIAGTALSSGTATSGQVLTANGSGAVTFSTPTQGLTLIKTEAFSGVASLSLNNVFSSTYRNYRLLVDAEGSSTTDLILRFRVGGVDASGAGTYKRQVLDVNGTSVSGNRTSETYALLGGVDTNDGAPSWFVIDITQPFLANESNWISTNIRNQASAFLSMIGGYHDVTTSYDGFTLATVASTNIAGQVSVYGYNA